MSEFANRHQIQEHLASLTTKGVIVELGCGYGNGVIALDKGNVNGLPIYSVDPYVPYSDPLGGKYDLDTYHQMLENTRHIVFTHVPNSALLAAHGWRRPIGLLWVDLSMAYEALWPIVEAWERFILPGGYLGITGLEYEQRLGTRQIYEEISGYDKMLTEQNLVAVLRKQ